MTFTARQVEKAVENYNGYDDGWFMAEYWTATKPQELDIDGEKVYAVYVDGKPGEEGGGERIWMVLQVGTQFFKKHGCHISHDGTYWDGGIQEVIPVEKTVTVYETL